MDTEIRYNTFKKLRSNDVKNQRNHVFVENAKNCERLNNILHLKTNWPFQRSSSRYIDLVSK